MESSIAFWGKAPRVPNGRFVNPAIPAANPVRVDPVRDALYNYDAEAQKELGKSKPWKKDPHYFRAVRVGALALAKMVMHARAGGELEVMGMMQGYADGRTLVITDAFRLPVEGTETRVNAQEEANEYLVEYLKRCREQGRMENVIGWYHSHPGYGCWLSGIDVDTEALQQQFSDPFVAVVIDPDRTISAGKVEIGAFRTYPVGYGEAATTTASGSGGSSKAAAASGMPTTSFADVAAASALSTTMTTATTATTATTTVPYDSGDAVPVSKAQDFGAHASRYYSLEVEHFKSQLDAHLLDLLWNKYWAQTLSQSPLLTNRDYDSKQMFDLAWRIRDVSRTLERAGLAGTQGGGGTQGSGGGGGGGGGGSGDVGSGGVVGGGSSGGGGPSSSLGAKVLDDAFGRVQRDSKLLAAREQAGLMAGTMKTQIFSGGDVVGPGAPTATAAAAAAAAAGEDVEMATVADGTA